MVRDRDTDTNNNNKFNVKMISVTPKPQGLEFYLEQRGVIALISFKGCLDHEVSGLNWWTVHLKMINSLCIYLTPLFTCFFE